jgi:signal transduction histidine kinase
MSLYFLCWEVLKRMWPQPRLLLGPWEEASGVLVTFCLMGLAPIAWQWTGDPRRRAGIPRGLVQAIVWNGLWLGALVALQTLLLPAAEGPVQSLFPMRLLGLRLPPETGIMIGNYPLALIFGWFMAAQEAAEADTAAAQSLADRARMEALQAQLHPHTLFNVLSGLTELVHEDAETAEEALVQLVDLYRMLMGQAASGPLPLARERELVERFLAIMELRLGSRLEVRWDWAPWADPLELPPFLVYPLVENAIKHGIAPSKKGGTVRVEVARTGSHLELLVADNGRPLKEGAGDGVGLRNLKERLRLMAGLEPNLELRQEGEWVTARLSLAWEGRR